MPPPRRIERLQQLIHEVAAQALQRDVSDPRLGFVTITRVKLGRDLGDATLYWSSLGTEAQKRTSARALEAATAMVQSMVAKALQTRTTPKLTFRFDPAMEHAGHLETIFEKIKRERPEGELPTLADALPAHAPDEDSEGDGSDEDAADDAPGNDPEAVAQPDADPTADGSRGEWKRKKPRK